MNKTKALKASAFVTLVGAVYVVASIFVLKDGPGAWTESTSHRRCNFPPGGSHENQRH